MLRNSIGKEKGLKLRQETKYPDAATTKLVFTCEKPVELTLQIRHPSWAVAGFQIRVNGRQSEPGKPGSYAAVTRPWKSGDTVEITMPFTLHTEGFRDNPNRFAFLNGPLVLAAAVDIRKPYPAIVAEEPTLLASLKPVAAKPNTFHGSPDVFRIPGGKTDGGMTLEPFYKLYDRHYDVYWDRFTSAEWTVQEQKYAAEIQRRKNLEARTVDSINPGEEQNERDHNLKGEKTNAGDFGDRHYRDATEGGWFSWDLKVLPGKSQELVLTYWGEDRGRHFDIVVDGQKLATEQLTAAHPGAFFDQVYSLSPESVRDREKITLKIQGSDTWAGGVFGVRIMKPIEQK